MNKTVSAVLGLAMLVGGTLAMAGAASAKDKQVVYGLYPTIQTCTAAGQAYGQRTGKGWNCVPPTRTGEWALAVWR